MLRRHRRRLKPLLLDQRVIAGLGNIYTDEALFRAGLHPLTASDTLGPPQIAALQAAIRAVLREAIRYQGTTFDQVYAGGDMQRGWPSTAARISPVRAAARRSATRASASVVRTSARAASRLAADGAS